jgi:uncharacterized integral membrane protein (TIGR00698 family)
VRLYGPGLALTCAGAVLAVGLNRLMPAVSALTLAVLLGATARNVASLGDHLMPGLQLGTRKLLRAGVVLMGLQLAVSDVLGLDRLLVLVIVVTVVVTFAGTLLLGPRMGVSWGATLLIATGFSICGASAAVAMNAVSDSDEEELVTTITLVTLFGSAAILLLPLLQVPLHLDATAFGAWSGASVHEVAQVVATAGSAGSAALVTATVVKLTRVVLLAPVIAGYSIVHRRGSTTVAGTRPALIPLFVVGFILMIGVRSLDVLPGAVISSSGTLTSLLFAGALFGLGTALHLPALRRTGAAATGLGLVASVLAAVTSYVGIVLVM